MPPKKDGCIRNINGLEGIMALPGWTGNARLIVTVTGGQKVESDLIIVRAENVLSGQFAVERPLGWMIEYYLLLGR